MDVRTQLLSELSRTNIDFTIHTLGNDTASFKELVNFIICEKDPLPMRAAWVLEGITLKYPEMILPFEGMLIRNLRKYSHPGTRRNILKIFSRMEIKEKYHGILLDVCFDWMTNEEINVAEKVYSMQIIANHLPLYPELKNEFLEILEDQAPKNSPGFISRARLIKKQLKIIK